ncbi:toll/interleukin-1 receptor domain-containing protein [Candidatus Micrarchaeota archaeon]|jgi:hypothetical protein|nr:toll/interleukin-1 receptor domain-containing protein [Candidatus Micrarchaeota archaeon]
MVDICVIYASENKSAVEKLVLHLQNNWEVWWDGDFIQGDWEKEVKKRIKNAKAVVAVFSSFTEHKKIFKDELSFAEKREKLIFPFFIEEVDPPLGFGYLNRTNAFGWNGDESHPGFRKLKKKISAGIGVSLKKDKTLERKLMLEMKNKSLKLPCFIFSLSSHETQVSAQDGVELFKLLKPAACLISAYDVWGHINKKRSKNKKNGETHENHFLKNINELRSSSSVLILDSGNYEAYRKDDRYSEEKNKEGWSKEKYRETVTMVSPDLAFSYDEPKQEGEISETADYIITSFSKDKEAIGAKCTNLCPIIHLPESIMNSPQKNNKRIAHWASQLAIKVVSELQPVMVAIPERELGFGLIERVRTVCEIRVALNSLGKYYPLHLLGTGNPISMLALAAAGADSFDGLEWCRTVADYDNGHLFHFQHFDFFKDRYLSRIRSRLIRMLIEDDEVPYVTQVVVYNFDFFNEWTKTMQDMIEAGQVEHLLKNIPNIGNKIFKELMIK